MGHPILRQQAEELSPEQLGTPAIQRLIDDMIATMQDYEGIGLAAPQVFQSLRLVVAAGLAEDLAEGLGQEDADELPLTVIANPVLVDLSSEQDSDWEGCLSIPDIRGLVPRSQSVTVHGLDRFGKPLELTESDLFARVLQHEVDHLDGALFLDRMEQFETLTFADEYRRFWAT